MSAPAWLLKWHAREALKNGDPEESQRLYDQLIASGQRGGWALRGDVVRGFVERAEKFLRADEVENAWKDLTRAEQLDRNEPSISKLRDTLVRFALAEIRAMMENGKVRSALDAIEKLRSRVGIVPETTPLEQAALDWLRAEELADAGEFSNARQLVEVIRELLSGPTPGLDRFEHRLEQREGRFQEASRRYQEVSQTPNHQTAITYVDEALSVAPRHRSMQEARSQLNVQLQPPAQASVSLTHTSPPGFKSKTPTRKFHLWIDGIGGYLVCLGARVTIGQINSETPVDIGIQADIPRQTAALQRENEGYLVESSRTISLNGKPTEKSLLQCKDRIELAPKVGFDFRLPVPGGNSARLEPLTARRLPNGIDGILLMHEWLLLGPSNVSHVLIPDLKSNLSIRRKADQLFIGFAGEFLVNGLAAKDRVEIDGMTVVEGDGFSFAVEPVE
jgi:tetratricopeptide (TPR) repeat protein